LLQLEQRAGEHTSASYKLNIYLALAYTLGGIGANLTLRRVRQSHQNERPIEFP